MNGLRRRRGRAGAAGHARAPVRGPDRLHLPRGALRARVRRGRARRCSRQSRPATVLVPIHGLEMRGRAGGPRRRAELVRGDRTDAPDEAVWGDPADRDRASAPAPNALLMLSREVPPDDPVPVAEARVALPPAAHRPAAVEARRHRAGRAGLAPQRRRALAAVRDRGHRRRPRRAVDPGRGRGGRARASSSTRSIGSPPRRLGGVGAVALRDGLRPASRVRGAVGLPARRCGRCSRTATATRPVDRWPCAWPCCAPRRASASGCSGGWSWLRRSSAS